MNSVSSAKNHPALTISKGKSMDHPNASQPVNPYAPPTAEVGFDPGVESANFIPGGRTVSAGSSLAWISGAWNLFKQKAGLWVGFALAYGATILVSAFIPFIGNLVMMFLPILLVAGVVYSCDLLEREDSFAFSDFFIGLKRQTGPLLIVCMIAFGFMIVLMIVAFLFFGTAMVGMIAGAKSSSTAGTSVGVAAMVIGGIVVLAGSFVYGMGIWFAPALVIMHNVEPVRAIKMSFSACLKNILPGIVFFLVMTVLWVLAVIPVGLGMLIVGPMFFISYYTSYRDIFLGRDD